MKFLVTGATGFVGANLVRKLLEDDQAVVSITAGQSRQLRRLEDVLVKLEGVFYTDLAVREAVLNLVQEIKPDIIYHLAAYGGFNYQREQDLILKANLQSTINLVDAAVSNDVQQFINSGSSSEYGIKAKAMREDDLCEPLSFYGITKLAATNYCTMVGKRLHYQVCTLRLFSPYGKFEADSRLYPTIVNALQKGEAPKLSSPDLVRDFIEVEKVVEVYLKITNSSYQPGDIINLGSGKQQSIKEFYDLIAKRMGSNIKPIWGVVPVRDNEPQRWEADISKLKSLIALGWG